jgi:hypothetical protein
MPRESQAWKCPHCHAENKADLPGKLVWVLLRQDNDVPPPKPGDKAKRDANADQDGNRQLPCVQPAG